MADPIFSVWSCVFRVARVTCLAGVFVLLPHLSALPTLGAEAPLRSVYSSLKAKPQDSTLLDLVKQCAANMPDGPEKVDAMVVYALGHLSNDDPTAAESVRQFVLTKHAEHPHAELLATSNLTVACSHCEGGGSVSVECASCGGSGKCGFCDGKGTRSFRKLNASAGQMKCTGCQGDGSCRVCKGTGSTQSRCRACNGSGRILDRAAALRALAALLERLTYVAVVPPPRTPEVEKRNGAVQWQDMQTYVAAVQSLRTANLSRDVTAVRMREWVENRSSFTGRVVRSSGVVLSYHPRSIVAAEAAGTTPTVVLTPDSIEIGAIAGQHFHAYGSKIPLLFTVGVLSAEHALLLAVNRLDTPPAAETPIVVEAGVNENTGADENRSVETSRQSE